MKPSREARRIGVKEKADHDGRRHIILCEAARLFTLNGFQNTKLVDLADRLNVTKPTLYHYIESKEEIIHQVLTIGNERNASLVRQARDSSESGLGKLEIFLRGYARATVDDFGRCVILADPRMLSGRLREQHRQAYRYVLDEIADIIGEGIRDGSIRDCDPHLLTFALMGTFNSLSIWFHHEGKMTVEDVTEAFLGFFESAMAAKP